MLQSHLFFFAFFALFCIIFCFVVWIKHLQRYFLSFKSFTYHLYKSLKGVFMLFSSFAFIFVFLPLVWIIFHLLKNAKFKAHFLWAKIFLIASSLFFYAFWKLSYLPILLTSIIINYTLSKIILRFSTARFDTTNGGGAIYAQLHSR